MNWLLLVTVHSRHLDSCQTDMFTFTTGIKNSFAQKSHRLILTTHHNINNERNSLGIINQQGSNWDVSEADWGLVFFPPNHHLGITVIDTKLGAVECSPEPCWIWFHNPSGRWSTLICNLLNRWFSLKNWSYTDGQRRKGLRQCVCVYVWALL